MHSARRHGTRHHCTLHSTHAHCTWYSAHAHCIIRSDLRISPQHISYLSDRCFLQCTGSGTWHDAHSAWHKAPWHSEHAHRTCHSARDTWSQVTGHLGQRHSAQGTWHIALAGALSTVHIAHGTVTMTHGTVHRHITYDSAQAIDLHEYPKD